MTSTLSYLHSGVTEQGTVPWNRATREESFPSFQQEGIWWDIPPGLQGLLRGEATAARARRFLVQLSICWRWDECRWGRRHPTTCKICLRLMEEVNGAKIQLKQFFGRKTTAGLVTGLFTQALGRDPWKVVWHQQCCDRLKSRWWDQHICNLPLRQSTGLLMAGNLLRYLLTTAWNI